jgi:hypothetical protein
MCNRESFMSGLRVVAAGILVSVAFPSTAATQSADDARRQLDSLLPQLREAKAAFDAIRPAKPAAAGTVGIERGHLRLRADSSVVAIVGQGAATASASLERVFGEHASEALRYIFFVQIDSVGAFTARGHGPALRVRRTDPEPALPQGATVQRAGDAERAVPIEGAVETVAALAAALEAVAAAPLHASLDDDLRRWFRSPLPATAESREELENLYIDLTTASTELSRHCLAGDVRRCRQVLGLDAIDDPIVDAYTTADRVRFVTAAPERLRVAAKAAEYDRCVIDRDDAACIARLRELPPESLTSAYSTTALRRSFARWALALGGPGAYARLRAATDAPLADRFGVAAGMPLDSAVASWCAHLIAGQPTRPAIPPLNAFATILWIGACGALALRSSRWR